ncbi:related to SPC1 - signal peptidase 10.8 kDa subunit [Moesziomyces antarcticus]|uniref:Signal peptidase complex subunit 1 n=1 Tax=Pseudozyma antarctica TaxID=84753 RepID=A0A5C3FKG3_PSEA2|nr:related to SPC1 - signal peptidase 10.8 kDa subunit [Moesziomyces antarcticus]
MESIQRFVDGKIEGLVAGASVAFLAGYFTQNMQLCMLIFAAATALVAIVTVPGWGWYNKHKTEWLPNRPAEPEK